MGFDLNALAGKNAITKVSYMGQDALIHYDPSQVTAAAVNKAQTGDAAFTEVFCQIVKDWDVKRGTKKVPLTAKGLEGIPLPLLRECFRAVVRAKDDGDNEGNSSSGS